MALPYRFETVTARGLTFGVGHWPGTGPKVFCLHGLTASHISWLRIAEMLQAEGYDVWGMDLRGRGRSDKPHGPYGTEVHADDAAAVIDALGLGKVLLLGHSLGAVIAIRLAAKYPEKVQKVVLADGGGVIRFSQSAKAIQAIRPALARLDVVFPSAEAYLNQMKQNVGGAQNWNEVLEQYYRYEMEELPGGQVRCCVPRRVIEAEFQAQGGSISPWRALWRLAAKGRYVKERLAFTRNMPYSDVQAPVLILQAGRHNVQPGDDILPDELVREMQARLPQSDAFRVEGVNHYGILLAPHPARDTRIKTFLAE